MVIGHVKYDGYVRLKLLDMLELGGTDFKDNPRLFLYISYLAAERIADITADYRIPAAILPGIGSNICPHTSTPFRAVNSLTCFKVFSIDISSSSGAPKT